MSNATRRGGGDAARVEHANGVLTRANRKMYSATKGLRNLGRLAMAGTPIAAPTSHQNHTSGAAMYYDEESGAINFVAGLLIGAVMGASLAFLTAPQSGRKTRKRLVRAVSQARNTAGDRWEDLADEVQGAVRASRKRIRL
jgi:hypothetical protein